MSHRKSAPRRWSSHCRSPALAIATLRMTALFVLNACAQETVKSGLDNLADYQHHFANKRIGIITNHTAYNEHGTHISTLFLNMPDVTVTAFFGPEHGIRGQAEAGGIVRSDEDPISRIPIYSLYGKTKKPTADMLRDLDLLVFDIQDIGTRFYTYVSTMALAMEAAAEHDKAFVVLDRPNPIGGGRTQGNVLEPEFASFVGLFPIPVIHGMTIGELAQLINGEGWLQDGRKADLTIVPLQNWRRSMWFKETGLAFFQPSPNIPNIESMVVYPGVCLLEGTNVSEGRGTDAPFLQFGAPWIDRARLARRLNELKLSGVRFVPSSFIPRSLPGVAPHPKYENRQCFGAKVVVEDRDVFEAYWMGIRIVNTLYEMVPDSLTWRSQHFDRLCGSDKIRKAIIAGDDLQALRTASIEESGAFERLRKKYLLYE